ncbi:MAG: hypothetical protein AAGK02_06030 [Pseudomonadota bacterium]
MQLMLPSHLSAKTLGDPSTVAVKSAQQPGEDNPFDALVEGAEAPVQANLTDREAELKTGFMASFRGERTVQDVEDALVPTKPPEEIGGSSLQDTGKQLPLVSQPVASGGTGGDLATPKLGDQATAAMNAKPARADRAGPADMDTSPVSPAVIRADPAGISSDSAREIRVNDATKDTANESTDVSPSRSKAAASSAHLPINASGEIGLQTARTTGVKPDAASPGQVLPAQLSSGIALTQKSRTLDSPAPRGAKSANPAVAAEPARDATRATPTIPAQAGQSPAPQPIDQVSVSAVASGPVSGPLSQAVEVRPEPRVAPAVEQAIDQLAQARESSRSSRPEVLVRHSDFGLVSMRIDSTATDLRATLVSRDSGFVPAVHAALADRFTIAGAEAGTLFQRGSDQAFSQNSGQSLGHSSGQGLNHTGLARDSGVGLGGGGGAGSGNGAGSDHGNGSDPAADQRNGHRDDEVGRSGPTADTALEVPRDGASQQPRSRSGLFA